MPQRKPAFLQFAENYFSFSRSQRRAMACMVIFGMVVMGYLYRQSIGQSNTIIEPFVTTEVVAELLVKEPGFSNTYSNNYPERNYPTRDYVKPGTVAPAGSLFFFDPNTATQDELLALGLREKTVQNIINYRNKGGRFRQPEDLAKLYSLKPEEAERLMPFLQIENEPETKAETDGTKVVNEAPVARPVASKLRGDIAPVDINMADSITWMVLPGIGAKRASAILRYRERLGGFISIAQVGETFGLPDSVFQVIQPGLTIGGGKIEQLSINTATEAELKAHPYIGWQIAKIIVAYRNQHGAYKSVDDLLKIYVIKKDWLEKTKPYLKVGE
jgi:competence ComEA-like helix-hairpin-helix protein